MYFPSILLLIGLATAAPTTNTLCSSVSKASCQTPGTAFCSSYLSIPAKTSTLTSFTTTVHTATTTSTSGTVTDRVTDKTITVTTTGIRLATSFVTVTSPTTTGTTTVFVPGSSFSVYYDFPGCTFSPLPRHKRAVATLSKPPCLSTYPAGTGLSSACKCLSIPTSTTYVTHTATATSTAHTTVDVGATKMTDVTETVVAIVYTTISHTITSTVGSAVEYTTTTTLPAPQATATKFTLNAVQNGIAYANGTPVYDSTMGKYTINFNSDKPAAIFTLTNQSYSQPNQFHCILTVVSALNGTFNGYETVVDQGETTAYLSPPGSNSEALPCMIEVDTGQLMCEYPSGSPPNSGYILNNEFNVNVTAPPGTFVTASPVLP